MRCGRDRCGPWAQTSPASSARQLFTEEKCTYFFPCGTSKTVIYQNYSMLFMGKHNNFGNISDSFHKGTLKQNQNKIKGVYWGTRKQCYWAQVGIIIYEQSLITHLMSPKFSCKLEHVFSIENVIHCGRYPFLLRVTLYDTTATGH